MSAYIEKLRKDKSEPHAQVHCRRSHGPNTAQRGAVHELLLPFEPIMSRNFYSLMSAGVTRVSTLNDKSYVSFYS
jgi:hypothetical protein